GAGPGARAGPAHRGGAARGRVRLGRHRPAEGHGSARVRPPAALCMALVVSGCASSLGTLGVVNPNADDVGLKLLTPGAIGRSCPRDTKGTDGTEACGLAGRVERGPTTEVG